jgi:hypothetical protein
MAHEIGELMKFISIDGEMLINPQFVVAILPSGNGGSTLTMVDGKVYQDSQRTPEQVESNIRQNP